MLSNKNIKILVNYVLGPLLFAWVAWSLYRQLSQQKDLSTAWQHIKGSFTGKQSWKLFAVIAMMFLNWGIEARKWQLLLKRLQKISFLTSIKAIFAGVAFSIVMPNRIGEYGGRLLFLEEGNRIRSVSLTLIGSLAQLIITLLLGMGGLIYVQHYMTGLLQQQLSQALISAILYFVSFISILSLLFYFKVSLIIKWLEKIPALSRIKVYIEVLDAFSLQELFNILWLSFLRYLVFTLQYVWLLQVMQVEIGAVEGFVLISVLFLLLALSPTFALLELVVRQELSILIIGMVSANTIGIITASFGIWLINLVLPAMAGSLLLIGVKVFGNKTV